MSDEVKVTSTPVVAPAGTPINVNIHSAPEKKASADAPAEAKGEPNAFEQAEARGANRVLKGLGVKKSERARLLEELKEGRYELAQKKQEVEAVKTEVQAAKTEVEALKPYQDRMKKYADQEFATLPEPFQKTLAAMKVEDPMARLDMIELWKSTGVIPAAAAPVAADGKPAPAVAKPSTTLAAVTPPTQAPIGTLNHYEQWNQMKNSGQTYAAAQYYAAHSRKIIEQRPSK